MPKQQSQAIFSSGAYRCVAGSRGPTQRPSFRPFLLRFREKFTMTASEYPRTAPQIDPSYPPTFADIRKPSDEVSFTELGLKTEHLTHSFGSCIKKVRRRKVPQKFEEQPSLSKPQWKKLLAWTRRHENVVIHDSPEVKADEQGFHDDVRFAMTMYRDGDTRLDNPYSGQYSLTSSNFASRTNKDCENAAASDEYLQKFKEQHEAPLQYDEDMIPFASHSTNKEYVYGDGTYDSTINSFIPNTPIFGDPGWLTTAENDPILSASIHEACLSRYQHLWEDPFADPIDQVLFADFDSSCETIAPTGCYR